MREVPTSGVVHRELRRCRARVLTSGSARLAAYQRDVWRRRRANVSRVCIPMVGSDGRAQGVELMVRRDTVESQADGLVRAVFDRNEMREWLAAPVGVLESDDVRFSRCGGSLPCPCTETLPWRLVPSYFLWP